MIDPLLLTQRLIQCPSVTPEEGGALDLLEETLRSMGFTCHRLKFEEEGTASVQNLYARLGGGKPHFCFAGHTDVVPVGDPGAWTHPPFDGVLEGGVLYGRGAVDMKGGVAAFVAAASRFLAKHPFEGSLSLLITGDEEGPAVNGTRKVLKWLRDQKIAMDVCLVGEPTSAKSLGDMVKIGRRGSLSGTVTVLGQQGHTAYPHRADNPIPRLMACLQELLKGPKESKSRAFPPSNIEITTIDVGNSATNVIPAEARATFNIRFNDQHTPESLEGWIRKTCDRLAKDYTLELQGSGGSYLTEPGPLSQLVSRAIETEAGVIPELSTSGGTSDARFIRQDAEVIEFGLVGQTMHKVDECVGGADLETLTRIYEHILTRYFEV